MRSRPNAAGTNASPRPRINWALSCNRLALRWHGARWCPATPLTARPSDFPHHKDLLEALLCAARKRAATSCPGPRAVARQSKPSQFAIQMREREARGLLSPGGIDWRALGFRDVAPGED